MEHIKQRLMDLSRMDLLHKPHYNYLIKIKDKYNFNPKVIYDIGSLVGHWSNRVKEIWPESTIYLFEAMDSVEFLYKEWNYEYHIGLLSDQDDKELTFYQCDTEPWGNSYYREKSAYTESLFGENSKRILKTSTVDTIAKNKNFLSPDFVKVDVQGAEIDVLKGMKETLKNCEHLIVELQHIEYNEGALLNTDSIPIIESMGFKLETPLFSNNGPDGDYHFIRSN